MNAGTRLLAALVVVVGAMTLAERHAPPFGSPGADADRILSPAHPKHAPEALVPAERDPEPTRRPRQGERRLARHFFVLRLPRIVGAPPDAPPLAPEIERRFHLWPDAVRGVPLPEARFAEIHPGDRGICIKGRRSVVCGTPGRAMTGGLIGVELCAPGRSPGGVRVFGLLPDEARNVELLLSDQRTVWSPLSNNVYDFVVDVLPASVTWTTRGRPHRRTISIPEKLTVEQCRRE